MCKKLLFLATLALSFGSMAAGVTTTANITQIYTYGTYENNNTEWRNQIAVKVDTTVEGCEGGFYISSDDNKNNPAMVSFLLSAFHADSRVRFSALDDDIRPGKFCRVINLALVK